MTHTNTIDPDLLSILRCPLTLSRLRQEGDFLVAEVGGLRYPVRDRLPIMLIEEAQLPPGFESLDAFKQRFGRAPADPHPTNRDAPRRDAPGCEMPVQRTVTPGSAGHDESGRR